MLQIESILLTLEIAIHILLGHIVFCLCVIYADIFEAVVVVPATSIHIHVCWTTELSLDENSAAAMMAA